MFYIVFVVDVDISVRREEVLQLVPIGVDQLWERLETSQGHHRLGAVKAL